MLMPNLKSDLTFGMILTPKFDLDLSYHNKKSNFLNLLLNYNLSSIFLDMNLYKGNR